MTAHTCHAPGCAALVPPSRFMCGSHWMALPYLLRRRLFTAYRFGQEIDKRPSAEYLAAAHEAIAWLAAQEGAHP